MALSVSNHYAPQASMSLTERASQNFTNHKWEIILPGPMGLASLVATIVFFVSNPFGWMFSAGLVGAGIALASLSAIGAIGYSLYHLLKEPAQIKNLVTKEDEPIVLIPPTPIYRIAEAEPAKQIEGAAPEQPPEAPKPLEQQEGAPQPIRKKKPVKRPPVAPAPKPALPSVIIEPEKPKEADSLMKRFTNVVLSNPKKSALVLGGLLLGGYGLYNYLAMATPNPYLTAVAMISDRLPLDPICAHSVPMLPTTPTNLLSNATSAAPSILLGAPMPATPAFPRPLSTIASIAMIALSTLGVHLQSTYTA